MRISDWSSDVFTSDLRCRYRHVPLHLRDSRTLRRIPSGGGGHGPVRRGRDFVQRRPAGRRKIDAQTHLAAVDAAKPAGVEGDLEAGAPWRRSEEHTSELQSLMRISYAVFCLKKKKKQKLKRN